ncbi:FAD-dependent oxidoreductase, partial [Enterococcus faecium]
MKIVIIGASHAGITAALNLRKLQPKAEVLLIDEDHKDGLGYVSNGINLYLKGK